MSKLKPRHLGPAMTARGSTLVWLKDSAWMRSRSSSTAGKSKGENDAYFENET